MPDPKAEPHLDGNQNVPALPGQLSGLGPSPVTSGGFGPAAPGSLEAAPTGKQQTELPRYTELTEEWQGHADTGRNVSSIYRALEELRWLGDERGMRSRRDLGTSLSQHLQPRSL